MAKVELLRPPEDFIPQGGTGRALQASGPDQKPVELLLEGMVGPACLRVPADVPDSDQAEAPDLRARGRRAQGGEGPHAEADGDDGVGVEPIRKGQLAAQHVARHVGDVARRPGEGKDAAAAPCAPIGEGDDVESRLTQSLSQVAIFLKSGESVADEDGGVALPLGVVDAAEQHSILGRTGEPREPRRIVAVPNGYVLSQLQGSQGHGAQSAKSATRGVWSDGLSQPRGARSTKQSSACSARDGEARIWSIRQPMLRSRAPFTR